MALATSNEPVAVALPRVLVLSGEIPQTRNAGAIVLYRLLRGYGRQPEAAEDRRSEIGDRAQTSSYELPSSASRSAKQAKLFVIGPRAHPEAEVLDCPYRELRMPFARLDNTRFSVLKRSLAARQLMPRPSHRKIVNLLGEFRPEVLVCVMIDTPWMCVAERTARKLGIPLVLIVHDINEEFEKVLPWAKHALFDKNCDVYRAASRRLCVSPEMAESLEQRYGVPGEVMYPNRSEELQPRALDDSLVLRASIQRHEARGERREGHASATLTLGYAGSLAYGYGEALVDLIPVLREVEARILISTPRPPEKLKALLEAIDVVEWMPHRADIMDMWRTMQERADVMILPYSNPAGSNELLYRTHFPSKLTEYLALGMPVVVSGPEEATGVRWACGARAPQEIGDRRSEMGGRRSLRKIEEGGAEIGRKGNLSSLSQLPSSRARSEILRCAPNGAVPCTTREELAAVLQRLKEDGKLRKELAKRAVEAGKRDFDPVMIRQNFWNALAAAA
jgi:glycosyltransferase involved in cell wall biosynthesis